MGFFDFLKKKPAGSNSTAELEILLQKAASDTSVRIEFYKKLLSENLYVLSGKGEPTAGKQVLKEGTSVGIVSLEDGRIPIFTSVERIFDKGVIKEQVNYLAIKGEDLFNLTRGATLVLNPYSDYGKELIPDEIDRLLSGNIFHSLTGNITINKKTKVLIGQPAIYPTEIVNALTTLFANEATVKAAYIGYIKFPDTQEPPHYVFCIEADGDIGVLNEKAGRAAQQYLKSGEFVDFVSKDAFNYFNSIEPFYKKE